MSLVTKIKNNPTAKERVLRMLMPSGQSRPRWWVRNFLNRFYHQRGKKSVIRPSARIDVLPFNNFILGEGAIIEDFSVVNNGMGDVVIGNRSFIGMSNVIIGPVEIGDNVIFAQHVVVSGLNHGYKNPDIPIKDQECSTKDIKIGADSWIGANVVITAGVTIGKHAVVAAGSVVTKSVPDYCIAAGNPARIMKQYNHKEESWKRVEK